MADATWKNAERRLAAIFGTTRIPPAVNAQRSDRGSDAPDAETDKLCLQFKSGYPFPGYLTSWLEGITRTAPAGKTGAVVWHKRGGRFADSLVILRASDFAALVQALPAVGSSPCSPPGTPADS